MAEVSIAVGGRNYRVVCDDGQEDHLMGLGRRFDEAMEELRSGFGEIGDQRLTVMAAILMTDRLDEAEQKIAALEQQLEGLRSGRDEQEALAARCSRILDNAALRIEQLAVALEAKQEPQREN